MPILGENKNITEEGVEKEAFVVSFTNGALGQLNELQTYFDQPNLTELVKLGISFLQQVKEQRTSSEENKSKRTL